MDIKKKAVIEAYIKSFGNVSQSCKAVGISRRLFYDWMRDDIDFKTEIESCEPDEIFMDFLESKLVQRISADDTTAIIFALKTRAKKRGYIEKIETDNKHTIEIPISKWAE
jgi:hypothetical protein